MSQIYIERDIEYVIKKAAQQFPSLIVTGPRQSGKTSLLKHLFSKTYRYVSLDEPDIRLMAVREPRLLLENYPPPVIIDEVQYAPGLFSFLKVTIDKNPTKKGQFLLTGSQSFPLMARVGESLAGRIAVFNLLSFSFNERLKIKKEFNLDVLKKMVFMGGFPELTVNKKMEPKFWFSAYLQTYLERDIRQLRQIGDLTDFQRFLELLAAFNGGVLNLSGLSGDLGVAVNTIKGWISVLEACNQIVLIKPFYKNKGKRIIKSPKVYFLDTGFLCYLNGITTKEQIFKGPLAGQLLESAIIGETIRDFYNRGEVPRVFWWRTSSGQEIDFIVERKGKIIPIEVKMTSRMHKNLAAALFSFTELFAEETKKAFLINLFGEKLRLGRKVESLPFETFIEMLAKDKI